MAISQTPRPTVVRPSHGKGVSQGATTHKDYQKKPCELTDIKAFCEHDEAPPKPPGGPAAPPAAKPTAPSAVKPAVPPAAKPAAPPAAAKPGGPRYAREEEAKSEAPPHPAQPPHPVAPHPVAPHTAQPPHPAAAAPAAKPSAQHPSPTPIAAKPLVLEVIPHAAEAEAPSSSTGTSLFGLGELSFSQGAAGTGDKVTLKAIISSNCSLHPKWKIKETGPGAASQPVILQGMQVTHLFLPPRIPKQFWLEKVQPRRYSVECEVHSSAPNAHKSLEVHVYPFVESKLTLTSKSTKAPKNGWEKALATVRDVIEGAFKEMTEIVPNLAKAEAKILEGELTLSNTWKENEEEETNLAHWQADIEAQLTILSLEVKIDLTEFAFLRKLKEKVDDFESYFSSTTGVDVEAGMYLTVGGETTLTGKGSFESGKLPHPESLKVAGSLKLGLAAELKAGRKANGKLLTIHGGGNTELIITGTPHLESGPKLWLDTELEWKPLHVELEATLRYPSNSKKPASTNGKLTPDQVEKDSKEGDKVGPSYKNDLFASIKRPLGKITLLSEEAGPAHPVRTPAH